MDGPMLFLNEFEYILFETLRIKTLFKKIVYKRKSQNFTYSMITGLTPIIVKMLSCSRAYLDTSFILRTSFDNYMGISSGPTVNKNIKLNNTITEEPNCSEIGYIQNCQHKEVLLVQADTLSNRFINVIILQVDLQTVRIASIKFVYNSK